MRSESSRGDLLGVGLVIAAVCLRFYPATLLGRRVVLTDDTLAQSYPFLAALFSAIRLGQLPAWSPEIFMGYPLASSIESQLFSPANWPLLLFETHTAMTVRFVGAFCAMAVFAYFVARHLGAGPLGAALSGLVFGVGNHALVAFIEPYALTTMMWFPLVFLCWDRACRGGRFGVWFPLAGLCFGLALLGGHVQHAYNFGLFIGAYALLGGLAAASRRAALLRCLAGGALSLAIASGVFAVNFLPSVATVSDSVRAHARREDRVVDPLRREQFAAVFFPRVTRMDGEQGEIGGIADYSSVGLIAVLLAVVGCGGTGDRGRRILALGVGALVLSCGDALIVGRWVLGALPLYDFREPHRIGLVFSFAVAVLAGRGLERILSAAPEDPGLRRTVRNSIVVLGLLGGLSLCLQGGRPFRVGMAEILVAAVPAALIGVWLYRPRQRASWMRVAFVGVMVVSCMAVTRVPGEDFFRNAGGGAPRVQEPRIPAYLTWLPREDVHGPTRLVVLPPGNGPYVNFPLLSGHQTPTGYLSLFPDRLLRLLTCGREGYLFAYDDARELAALGRRGILDVLGIRYLVTRDVEELTRLLGPSWRDEGFALSSRDGFAVATNARAMPRSYFIEQAFYAADEEQAFRRVLASGFDPRREVVIEGRASTSGLVGAGAATSVPAMVAAYGAERVAIQVDAPGDGWLVLMDRYAPGWSCLVRGQAAPIYRANFVGRAVRVSAGRSDVVFSYSRRPLVVGGWLTILATLAAAGAATLSALLARSGDPGAVQPARGARG